jgi:hypothetical protein
VNIKEEKINIGEETFVINPAIELQQFSSIFLDPLFLQAMPTAFQSFLYIHCRLLSH